MIRVRFTPDPAAVDAAASHGQPTPQLAAERWVSDQLTAAGAGHVLLAIEDPSAPGEWTALVDRKPKASASLGPAFDIEPVDAAPRLQLANVPSLDRELLSDEVRAVALALIKDTDPERLEGMAACFAADLPIVGALLHTRARLEAARRELRPQEYAAHSKYLSRLSTRADAKLSHGRRGLGSRAGVPAAPAKDATSHAVDLLRRATVGLGASAASTWDRYGGAIDVLMADDPPVSEPVTGGPAAISKTVAAAPASSVDVARAFDAVDRSVDYASAPPSDLAYEIDVDLNVAAAVLSSVIRPGGGVVLIDPAVAGKLAHLAPAPSASAIQLAAGQIRPLAVGLSDPTHAGRTLYAVRRGSPYDEAVAQVDRGKRAVARRVWVEWYRRAEAAGMLGDVR